MWSAEPGNLPIFWTVLVVLTLTGSREGTTNEILYVHGDNMSNGRVWIVFTSLGKNKKDERLETGRTRGKSRKMPFNPARPKIYKKVYTPRRRAGAGPR